MFTIPVSIWFTSMLSYCVILWFLSRNDEDHNDIMYFTAMSWTVATVVLFVESLGQ